MKILNKIILSLICATCVFGFLSNVFATTENNELEIIYPTLSNFVIPPDGTRTFLPHYIQYIYNVAVFAGGLIAFISLLVGGIRYLMSVGNPGTMKDARDQIFAGILGMVIIFGSFIILKELNPDLTSFALPELASARKGIVWYSDAKCGMDLGNGEPFKAKIPDDIEYMTVGNTKTNLVEASGQGKRIASIWPYHSRRDMNVSFYENGDCSGPPQITNLPLVADECFPLPTVGVNIQCIMITWRDPGVWLFTEANDNPMAPTGEFVNYKVSQSSLPSNISDKIKSIALVKEEKLGYYYGVIVYNIANGAAGWAEIFLPSSADGDDITTYNLDLGTNEWAISAITVFLIPKQNTSADDSDTFTLYRDVGKYAITEKSANQEIPQLKIGWINTDDNNKAFIDITDLLCKGRNGKVSSFDNAAVSTSTSDWTGISDNCGGGFKNVVGGLKLTGEHWMNDQSQSTASGGHQIKTNDDSGVTGFYMPSANRYVALLYTPNPTLEEPLAAAAHSAINKMRAIPVYGSYASLQTLTWDDRLATLVVIRERH
jgi:hypothetical protein